MKKGDKVRVTEKARNYVPWYELSDVEFTIVDILEESPSIPCNYVLNYPLFGKDWVQFFKKDELIPLD